jgi:hypothetical protein
LKALLIRDQTANGAQIALWHTVTRLSWAQVNGNIRFIAVMVLTNRLCILIFPVHQKESVSPGVSRRASVPGLVNQLRFPVAVHSMVSQYFSARQQHDHRFPQGWQECHRDFIN